MNDAEVTQLLEVVRSFWPHSNLGDDPDTALEMWLAVLGDLPAAEVQAALVQLARSGREHAPPVGVIAHAVDQARQAPAPSFEDAMAILGKHYQCLPYRPSGTNPPEDLPVALENLTRAGVPEPVLRLVAALGVYAIRNMPDGSQHPLDPNQRAQRRDAARTYTHEVLPDLKSVPTPGLALRRAVAQFGQPDPSRLIDVARLERRRLERRRQPAALPAPEAEDGPTPEEVEAMLRRTREGISATRADRARAEREQRQREDEEVRQAAAELAEHAARRRAEREQADPEPPQAA